MFDECSTQVMKSYWHYLSFHASRKFELFTFLTKCTLYWLSMLFDRYIWYSWLPSYWFDSCINFWLQYQFSGLKPIGKNRDFIYLWNVNTLTESYCDDEYHLILWYYTNWFQCSAVLNRIFEFMVMTKPHHWIHSHTISFNSLHCTIVPYFE